MDKAEAKQLIEEIVKHFVDKGMLVEGGWQVLRMIKFHGPEVTPSQEKKYRLCYLSGAQHVFSSILGMLEGGTEPTGTDEARMEMIYEELKKAQLELVAWDVA